MLRGRELGAQQIADQGPATGRRGRSQSHHRPARVATHPWSEHPKWEEGVVRDLARPHHVPDCLEHRVLIARAGGVVEIAEERCAAALQVIAEALMDFTTRPLLRLADQPRPVGPEIQRDPPIGTAQRSPAGPDHLAHRDQLVEELRPILAYPNREHVPVEPRGPTGTALELEEHLAYAS